MQNIQNIRVFSITILLCGILGSIVRVNSRHVSEEISENSKSVFHAESSITGGTESSRHQHTRIFDGPPCSGIVCPNQGLGQKPANLIDIDEPNAHIGGTPHLYPSLASLEPTKNFGIKTTSGTDRFPSGQPSGLNYYPTPQPGSQPTQFYPYATGTHSNVPSFGGTHNSPVANNSSNSYNPPAGFNPTGTFNQPGFYNPPNSYGSPGYYGLPPPGSYGQSSQGTYNSPSSGSYGPPQLGPYNPPPPSFYGSPPPGSYGPPPPGSYGPGSYYPSPNGSNSPPPSGSYNPPQSGSYGPPPPGSYGAPPPGSYGSSTHHSPIVGKNPYGSDHNHGTGIPCVQGCPQNYLDHTLKISSEYNESGHHVGPLQQGSVNGYGSGYGGGYNGAFNRPGF